ncbi:DNA polymerase IV [Parasphingopyxis algicola]|uniref:DNA polymerase IV n=1 Tax=Parasphingopyxis algicola TaxID=2026624 RepID=UPI0015A194C5|nr:DNA polymerase IV [Parasphingopyxis algicola]QLC26965.1 DNA polymerase IV [Parasphingopyxis algicola]
MPPDDAQGDARPRKIIHIDMDAFYASVEQRDNPELRGRPVAVGGSSGRGVVAAASYEAREFGVRSAMPSVTAKRRCPDLVFVRARFDIYRAVSNQIRGIFKSYTDLVEPLSLDEAYLDVTAYRKLPTATATAEEIRARIRDATGLTASAGVSYNKFLAKIASDQNKPDGICVVTPKQGPKFVARLPVRRFHGVGPKTAEKMKRLGIETGADLRAQSIEFLEAQFGKSAQYYYRAARGIDDRQVKPNRIRKSLGAERTYGEDLHDRDAMIAKLEEVADTVWERAEKGESYGRTVTLKLRYADFETPTRARSLAEPVASRDALLAIGIDLLDTLIPDPRGVRLLGLTMSGFGEKEEEARDSDTLDQLDLRL